MIVQRQETTRLRDPAAATAFYEARYAEGYMEDWPPERKRRIAEILGALALPATGAALDFGCGNGTFTAVLRETLPRGWSVSGLEVSATAIANARRRVDGCEFLVAGVDQPEARTYTLVFSHHVLEHVFDLDAVLAEIDGLVATDATMLHVLPCGNEGSFEHGACLLHRNGIDAAAEGRFFFEDEGHLRRLTSAELAARLSARGFVLAHALYSGQYWGAIDWITQQPVPFLLRFTDPATARDTTARRTLRWMRVALIVTSLLRRHAGFVLGCLRGRLRRPRHLALLPPMLPFLPLSWPLFAFLRARATEEWRTRSSDPGGSEMYLVFERRAAGPAASSGR